MGVVDHIFEKELNGRLQKLHEDYVKDLKVCLSRSEVFISYMSCCFGHGYDSRVELLIIKTLVELLIIKTLFELLVIY